MLTLVKPDLVAMTGDSLSGHRWKHAGYSETYYEDNWKRWTEPYLRH